MTLTATAATERPGKSIASLFGPSPSAARPGRSGCRSPRCGTTSGGSTRRARPDIWGTATVPHGITSNPRIANTYARLALAFPRAAVTGRGRRHAATRPTPHIVEFGGGAGRFAYLFVRQLRELAPRLALHATS